ncbi:MAG: hypothetical protein ACKPKE_18370 [Microcystis panniformis]
MEYLNEIHDWYVQNSIKKVGSTLEDMREWLHDKGAKSVEHELCYLIMLVGFCVQTCEDHFSLLPAVLSTSHIDPGKRKYWQSKTKYSIAQSCLKALVDSSSFVNKRDILKTIRSECDELIGRYVTLMADKTFIPDTDYPTRMRGARALAIAGVFEVRHGLAINQSEDFVIIDSFIDPYNKRLMALFLGKSE